MPRGGADLCRGRSGGRRGVRKAASRAFERIQSMRQQCADKGRGGRECGVCANGRGKHPPRRCNACVHTERSAENERGNRRNGGNIAQSGDTENRGELC